MQQLEKRGLNPFVLSPVLLAAIAASISKHRAGSRISEVWQHESGDILPGAAPAGTRDIMNMRALSRYLKRYSRNPLRDAEVKQVAKSILEGGEQNAFFLPLSRRGDRPTAVIASPGTSKKVFAHEYGHALDFRKQLEQKGRASLPGSLSSKILAPVIGAKNTPLYNRERRAWEYSGVAPDDPLRTAALGTYEASLKMPEYLGRYGIPASIALHLLSKRASPIPRLPGNVSQWLLQTGTKLNLPSGLMYAVEAAHPRNMLVHLLRALRTSGKPGMARVVAKNLPGGAAAAVAGNILFPGVPGITEASLITGAGAQHILRPAMKPIMRAGGKAMSGGRVIWNRFQKPLVVPKPIAQEGANVMSAIKQGAAYFPARETPVPNTPTVATAPATTPGTPAVNVVAGNAPGTTPTPASGLATGAVAAGAVAPKAPKDMRKPASADDLVPLHFTDKAGNVKGELLAEIADTPETRRTGLSKRAVLLPGHGMFFDKAGAYWMKDVNFPLDIVFLDKKGTVLEKQHMPVDAEDFASLRRLYVPSVKEAEHAIELPVGWFEAHGIAVGDMVKAVQSKIDWTPA